MKKPHIIKEDIPEVELPPRKRLCLTALTSRYKVGESSTTAPRPTGGHGIDYGFISNLDAKTRRQRVEEVGYGIRDVWVDPTEAVEEVAPMTIEGVNARVIELAAVQEQDTQDVYAGQLSTALGLIQALQARGQTHADDHEGANNMPPRRSSATTRAAATVAARAAVAAATPMTTAAVEQLLEARVSATLANHETLRNSTNGQGDGSHISDTGIRGTGNEEWVNLSQWFEKMESVFHISNCVVENQVKFATCTFLGNALTWWNSHMKTITKDVAYAMDWKALKKMMTVKYCPRGEMKKLEIELWNLKVKGTDVASYTLRFQELAPMCGRMFHEESDEVEKYVGGLPDMIWGNVMSYQPKMMEKAIEFANDQMDQKVLTIAERQAKQKRKLEFNEHFKRDCPKLKNKNRGNQGGNGNALAKVYVVGNAGTNPDSNVVTGTFLLNNRYAFILFDTGADRSFVSTTFSSPIDITPTTLDHYYDVELADEKIIGINTIIRGCTLNFLDHPFNINLMPVEIGSFDVIVGMDWLATTPKI
ncbi:putative reverse transcriptase domain-containing protein [Tanacetum coccineum]